MAQKRQLSRSAQLGNWAANVGAAIVRVLGAAALITFIVASAKTTWLLVTSPVEYFSLLWRSLVAGYQIATDLASVPVPYVLTVILVGIAAAIVANAIVLFLSFTKRRRVLVFVSYHNSMLGVVKSLASSLNDDHIQITYVLFTSKPEHDALLDKINRDMQESDFVVVLPGPEPSFVDHEVLAASVARKPIIIALPLVNGGSPNTAQRSYPVFILDALVARNFKQLRSLIDCLHGSRRQVWRSLTRVSSPPEWLAQSVLVGLVTIVVFMLVAIVLGLVVSIYLLAFQSIQQGMLISMARVFSIPVLLFFIGLFLTAVAPFLYLGGVVLTSSQRIFAAKIVARQVWRGRYAYDQLKQLSNLPEISSEVLDSLWTVPPPPYHQRKSSNETATASGTEA